MYAKLEEDHGLARHAMTVYERSTTAVLPEEQFEVCELPLHSLWSILELEIVASTASRLVGEEGYVCGRANRK